MSASEIRKKYGIDENAFMVFFNFDYASGYGRKNPEGAIRAFAKAFSKTDDNAILVLKTQNAARYSNRVNTVKNLAEELGVSDRTIMIEHYLPEKELYALTNACDVYLSLHRGEGFGLTLAEAMVMGRAVVCTDWSSTTEFCVSECAFPVPYKLVDVVPDMLGSVTYGKVVRWAEPDVDVAAAILRRLHDDPDLRKVVGDQARGRILNQFSVENFRRSVEEFLVN